MLARQTTQLETEKQRFRIASAVRQRPKTCRFQMDRNQYYDSSTSTEDQSGVESTEDKREVVNAEELKPETPNALPKIAAQIQRRLMCNQFMTNARKSVDLRRRHGCPWMRGNEMHHFYTMWQQPLTTPKQRMRKPLKRVQSLLKDFRYPDERNKPASKHEDFGIVRPCCSTIRSRIRMPGDPV